MLQSKRWIGLVTGLLLLSAVEAEVPFPTDAREIAVHCLAAGFAGAPLGGRFKLDKTAIQLTDDGRALVEQLLTDGALPRDVALGLRGSVNPVGEQTGALLRALNMLKDDGELQWSVEGAKELNSHFVRCKQWIETRPPTLAPMPQEKSDATTHCIAVMGTTQQLSVYKGPRSGEVGGLMNRLTASGRDMLGEVQQRRLVDPQAMQSEAKPPDGKLYVYNADLLLSLKLITLRTGKPPDVRSLRLLEQRLRQCHALFGLQMPLQ